ncbi:SDR family NAD(P)-dependent oxidoreductase [Nocardia seriolae]|uniref:Short-chain dehydrogenase n=1 Tax=Nocardia seriolae TaxID=37332 RepID=A0A0B8NQJ0_9NOCA|nr:SDR family NAD(P)-dependent oxidoreductase [Nocardia seriolae]MTJ65971.1 SDR family NAD(P)-dependent oxidoreductase [Nocardia seriolae]MTJ75719.1 SDR family NAD(P)-dependent oxidoreductase [Nocardia seriolae]MTJ86103.1 SDR family NAD(P)-dependent oxidoreductase [Nocardia seriolae]MTK30099.1 SDR family NAD(P)-dependent oxidoreductase [Nocardia seriolae]MTK43972.1 SDR family NAD(P)-dependent oxidoreductase [Nocardia seriolae]
MRISGSTALVTGANRGLGARLVAELLRRDAATVYVAARNPQTIAEQVRRDPRVRVLTLDVTDPASVAAAAGAAAGVDLLINNAGVLGFGDVLTGDLALFERDLSTNYLGALRVTRAFLPSLRAAGERGAAVVNVLTLIALAPVAPMAGYSASKAAAHSMTQALRAAVRDDHIEVIGAYPGGIDTDMLAGVEADKADPAEVAARILAGVEAGQEVIWPDDASTGAGKVYLGDPIQLETMLAA